MGSVVGSNRLTVVGNRKIYFKDPVTELIIKQKGLIGIGIRIFKNSAKSVRDVRRFIHPRVVEIIWLGITGSWCSYRFIQVVGGVISVGIHKNKETDSANRSYDKNDTSDNDADFC